MNLENEINFMFYITRKYIEVLVKSSTYDEMTNKEQEILIEIRNHYKEASNES